MKTTIKVFLWIGMIVGCIAIFPVIVGVLTLEKLEKAKDVKDLKTMGWLSMFFCNMIAGIMLVTAKNSDLGIADIQENSTITNGYELIESEVEEELPKKVDPIRELMVLAFIFNAISIIFSIVPISEYNGITFIPLIINIVGLGTIIASLILHEGNKTNFTKSKKLARNILIWVYLSICILQIVFSILSYSIWVYEYTWYYHYNSILKESVRYGYDEYCVAWEYWVTFGIALFNIILIVSAIIQIFKKKDLEIIENQEINTHMVKVVQKKPLTKAQMLEKELTDVKQLYESKVVSEEEYNHIRDNIIKKYYN